MQKQSRRSSPWQYNLYWLAFTKLGAGNSWLFLDSLFIIGSELAIELTIR